MLLSVADAVAADPRTEAMGEWTRWPDGNWSLRLLAKLSVAPTAFVPAESVWQVVVDGSNGSGTVTIYPDGTDGIRHTFQHQNLNGEPVADRPWLKGDPCLLAPAARFGTLAENGEPGHLEDKLLWRIGRLLEWIDAAASSALVSPGDPLELPPFPNMASLPVIGFSESGEDLDGWKAAACGWGFARLKAIPSADRTFAIDAFLAPTGDPVRKVRWTSAFDGAASDLRAVWMRVPRLPSIEPWGMPTDWLGLSRRLARDGVDLGAIIEQAGIAFRARSSERGPHRLLLGFPLAERVEGPTERIHWLCVGELDLSHAKSEAKGFRSTEEGRRIRDRRIARFGRPLRWQRTSNWASDQLRSRGAAEDALLCKRVLVIGCGSLGSAVASNLLRMGVTAMGVMDYDRLDIGNLSRHVLDTASVGHPKAEALAKHLNATRPDAAVTAFPHAFFARQAEAEAAFRAHDVVVDCTASDDMLTAMADFDWKGEKLFVSLSMTWRAEGLLAYATSEASFPAIDARAFFSGASAPLVDLGDANIEGMGCWHPVFPATADDVQLWAAVGTKFIRRAASDPVRRFEHYRAREDGTIVRDGH